MIQLLDRWGISTFLALHFISDTDFFNDLVTFHDSRFTHFLDVQVLCLLMNLAVLTLVRNGLFWYLLETVMNLASLEVLLG